MTSRSLTDLEPGTQERAYKLIDMAGASGTPIMVTATYRTIEEQDALYAQGRTTPGKIVTQARGGFSWHNFRRAFDICFVDPSGKPDWLGPWKTLGAMGEGLELTWGGRWPKHPDRPHFEYHPGLTLADARRLAGMTQVEPAAKSA